MQFKIKIIDFLLCLPWSEQEHKQPQREQSEIYLKYIYYSHSNQDKRYRQSLRKKEVLKYDISYKTYIIFHMQQL